MKEFKNPLVSNYQDYDAVSDPFVTRYNNKYIQCYGRKKNVCLKAVEDFSELAENKETVIFEPDDSLIDTHWFAPELHKIGNRWYVYGAPCSGEFDGDNAIHCMKVLESVSEDPLGEYVNKGVIKGIGNVWSIDGTVLEYEGKIYFIWTDCGHLYISKMKNPFELDGETVILKETEFEFEKRDGIIIEGPAVLKYKDKIHLAYSANNSMRDDYCIGIMTFLGGDILNPENWKKYDYPFLEKTDKIFGPGHCSFTTSGEGEETKYWIFYHANIVSGSGWKGRNVFAQEFTFDENDLPVFGEPHF